MTVTATARRAIVIAGWDTCARTALAAGWRASWDALCAGVRNFDTALPQRLVGWPDDAPVAHLDWWPDGPALTGRASALAQTLGEDVRPIHDALVRANPGLRLSIVLATSHGEPDAVSELAAHELAGRELSARAARTLLSDPLLRAFCGGLGTAHPGCTVTAACASACVATGLALERLRADGCDACLVVSLDVLSRIAHSGFRQIGAMSKSGCRPFDLRRDGTTIAEAGAVLLLAHADVALPSAIRWRAHALGFGQTCDARHPVEPSADGVVRAMARASADAGCAARDLAAVYWHGTGTLQNDRVEAEAARRFFDGQPPPGTSTKGGFGHAMGASAALSILAAGETLVSRRLPPVAGLDDQAFADLNIVGGRAVEVGAGPVVVVALGFGGINAALVMGACEEHGPC